MTTKTNGAVCRDIQPGDATRYTYTQATMEVAGYNRPLTRTTVNVGGFNDFGRWASIVINSNSDHITYIGCDADSYSGKMLALIAASRGVVGEMGPEWAAYAGDPETEGFWWASEIQRLFNRSADAA